MVLLGGYVISAPTSQGPRDLPSPLRTISHCLLDDLPRPADADWFTDRVEAEKTLAQCRAPADLVAVGLEEHLADALRAACDEDGASHFFHLLDQRLPMPADAVLLGHEVVGCETDFSFHSWHCHGYAGQVRRELGIVVDHAGLLADFADALRVLHDLRTRPAQDAPYEIPWTVASLARCPAVGG
ncbi:MULTISPECIES: hypothetical protein [unclassified Kribbella]|uniref:hypothetical protein n=1 Tax=unclassified Kribbella TaxID=2644121 RepID=UPI003017F069